MIAVIYRQAKCSQVIGIKVMATTCSQEIAAIGSQGIFSIVSHEIAVVGSQLIAAIDS